MNDQAVFRRAFRQGTEWAGSLQDAVCSLRNELADPAASPLLRSSQVAIESLRKSPDSLAQTVLQPLDQALEGLASTLTAQPSVTVDRLVAAYRSLADLLRERAHAPTPPFDPAVGADSLLEAMDRIPMEEDLKTLQETLKALLKGIEGMDTDSLLTRVKNHVSIVQGEIVSGLDRKVFEPLTEGLNLLRSRIDSLPIAETVPGIRTFLAPRLETRGEVESALQPLQPLLNFLSIMETHQTPPKLEDFLQDAGDFASKLETLALGQLPAACREILEAGMPVLKNIGNQDLFEKLKQEFAFRFDNLQNTVKYIMDMLGELEARGKIAQDPMTRALEAVEKTVTLDPEAWMSPLRSDMASLCADLSPQALAPGLGELQEQFGSLTASLQTLDPDSWSSTLRPLYREIQDLFARLPPEKTEGPMDPTLEEKLRALDPVPLLTDMNASYLSLQVRIASLDPSGLGDHIKARYRPLSETLEKRASDALGTVSAALNACLEAPRTALSTLQDNVGPLGVDFADALRAFEEMDFRALSGRLESARKNLEARFQEWRNRGDQALAAIAGQVGRLQARGVV